MASCCRIDLFREEIEIVTKREQALEMLTSLRDATYADERIGQPEAAREKRALLSGETVHAVLGAVAQHVSVLREWAMGSTFVILQCRPQCSTPSAMSGC